MSVPQPPFNYKATRFLVSAARFDQCPPEPGLEVAFVGRSNVGKSSTLNALTNNSRLARASKTPGRTRLINFFAVTDYHRLVDLPGYGYARVSEATKKEWQHELSAYMEQRSHLIGIVLLVDIRHPLKDVDQAVIQWAVSGQLPLHILLTKSDKLKRGASSQALRQLEQELQAVATLISVQLFSAHSGTGTQELADRLDSWFSGRQSREAVREQVALL